jgi:acylphosphatase
MQRLIQVHLTVHGEIHGSGMRSLLQREATRVGAVGWARNIEGGGLEAVIQAGESTVALLVRWCERGPLSASVASVEVTDQAREAFFGFDVRH